MENSGRRQLPRHIWQLIMTTSYETVFDKMHIDLEGCEPRDWRQSTFLELSSLLTTQIMRWVPQRDRMLHHDRLSANATNVVATYVG